LSLLAAGHSFLCEEETVKGQMEPGSVPSTRRWDIDWLRVLATLLLFYFHSAKIFYQWSPFYILNDPLSRPLSYISLFIEHWHMPLFFVLAGTASWFALRRRTGGQYALERLKRLLVPYLFGLLVIVPPQLYFALRPRRPDYAESYLQFYPHFFDPDYTGGKFDMGHLWFILFLFLFSLIALPLFLYLRRDSGQRLVDRLAGFLSRPGTILLLVLPIILLNAVPLGYPNPVYFLIYFIYGYMLMADERFGQAIDKHKLVALILGVAIYVVWIALVTAGVLHPDWMKPVRESLIAWLCLIALLGYGRQFLNFSNGFLRYFSEASYALYILHQTVIVIVGYYVVQWSAGILPKLLVILGVSFLITLALYDMVVKRTNVTRFLFGMRPLRKKASEVPAQRREKAAG
jgi:peptidoglycan/LPS O-acetylase OafA/YrhL